ncbi:endonuclease I family protein [Mesobacillus subterraneus]|uniref:Endonuclease I n=1 Tax=Mesobacillus subterraneus TaxID=285983 RepID=A0A427TF47_9BACI|nr:endonuclease [Mesobacillus subterraneus]RSD21504.1 endonuclease I [Mesobacillus subterraneus]
MILSAWAAYIHNIEHKNYFDAEHDAVESDLYYRNACFTPDGLHSLLKETHTTHLKYSPHDYVYPWVDLQEDLQLKSLYSGQALDPVEVIEEDLRMMEALRESGLAKVLFNTEHVVPQSWFDGEEPMRGDLHHLFACEPGCNSMRSNLPYHDFQSYEPEFAAVGIRTGCGMVEAGKFEPEYGKGIVARAVFYFALRYLDVIRVDDKMDFAVLLGWHHDHPVTRYEKHRNAAIQELQGNRNPFIDFADRAESMLGL